MNQVVLRNRKTVRAEADQAIAAFQAKYGMRDDSPVAEKCAAARQEMNEATLLGALWKNS